jgi:hypothetical protein
MAQESTRTAQVSETGLPAIVREKGEPRLIFIFATFLVIAATLIAYKPILFNFFVGDDYVHLDWLARAVHHPDLIWKNFHSSWLSVPTARFYRPLISVFMVSDYLVWGRNAVGFHLTNIAFHLASAAFLFLIVLELNSLLFNNRNKLWPYVSCFLFALYPLHSEVVSWITGRVDCIVTAFWLCAFWGYINWRQNQHDAGWFLISFLSTIAALLSKEMAIVLPLSYVLFDFSLWLKSRKLKTDISISSWRVLFGSIPFWMLLGAYFLVRYYALGSVVGGYDNSLTFSDFFGHIQNWITSLNRLFDPINVDMVKSGNFVHRMWRYSLLISATLGAFAACRRPSILGMYVFLASWFCICLLPVYKIFGISPVLEGSRFAYLASAPACAVISFGFYAAITQFKDNPIYSIIRSMIIALMIVQVICAGYLLYWNNQAWRLAGEAVNLVSSRLHQFTAANKSNRKISEIILFDLPDQMHGAYATRNAIGGLVGPTNIGVLNIDSAEQHCPLGLLKSEIEKNRFTTRCFRWDEKSMNFISILIPKGSRDNDSSNLIGYVKFQKSPLVLGGWQKDNVLELTGKPGVNPRIEIDATKLPFSERNCWTNDLLAVDTTLLAPLPSTKLRCFCFLSNQLAKEVEVFCDVDNKLGPQRLVFSMRGNPALLFGNQYNKIEIAFPEQTHILLNGIYFLAPEKYLPQIGIASSEPIHKRAPIVLEDVLDLHFDVRYIADARSISLALVKAGGFGSDNPTRDANGQNVLKTLDVEQTSGTIKLIRSDFPGNGMYEGRVWAINAKGQKCGLGGDHFEILVRN